MRLLGVNAREALIAWDKVVSGREDAEVRCAIVHGQSPRSFPPPGWRVRERSCASGIQALQPVPRHRPEAQSEAGSAELTMGPHRNSTTE